MVGFSKNNFRLGAKSTEAEICFGAFLFFCDYFYVPGLLFAIGTFQCPFAAKAQACFHCFIGRCMHVLAVGALITAHQIIHIQHSFYPQNTVLQCLFLPKGLHQLGSGFLGILVGRDDLTVEQVIDGNAQHLAQLQHNGRVWHGFSRFPFGHSSVGDTKLFCQLQLGQILFLSAFGNKLADLYLIHNFLRRTILYGQYSMLFGK